MHARQIRKKDNRTNRKQRYEMNRDYGDIEQINIYVIIKQFTYHCKVGVNIWCVHYYLFFSVRTVYSLSSTLCKWVFGKRKNAMKNEEDEKKIPSMRTKEKEYGDI